MEKPASDHELALKMAQERKRQLVEKMQKRNAWSPLRQIIDECIERVRPAVEPVQPPDSETN